MWGRWVVGKVSKVSIGPGATKQRILIGRSDGTLCRDGPTVTPDSLIIEWIHFPGS